MKVDLVLHEKLQSNLQRNDWNQYWWEMFLDKGAIYKGNSMCVCLCVYILYTHILTYPHLYIFNTHTIIYLQIKNKTTKTKKDT